MTLWPIFLTVFLAEFGDKTQIAMLLFAADQRLSRIGVFLASAGALVLSSLLAVVVGRPGGAVRGRAPPQGGGGDGLSRHWAVALAGAAHGVSHARRSWFQGGTAPPPCPLSPPLPRHATASASSEQRGATMIDMRHRAIRHRVKVRLHLGHYIVAGKKGHDIL